MEMKRKVGAFALRKIDASVVEESPVFLEPSYQMKRYVISKSNISRFKPIPSIVRDTRIAQINSILKKGLMVEKHFENPLVIEKWNSHLNTLDGNHRIEAIKRWLKKYPSNKIAVYCAVYGKLTDDERRQVYHTWNIAVRQNTDDFICAFKYDIHMYRRIITELPCDIYGNRDQLKFKHFVGGYLAAKFLGHFQGGFQGGAYEFVEKSMELTDKDVNIIKEFWTDLVAGFNILVGTQSLDQVDCCNTSPFYALFRLWYVNKDTLGREEIVRRFSRPSVHNVVKEWAPLGGRESCKNAVVALISKLDYQISDPNKLFRQDPPATNGGS